MVNKRQCNNCSFQVIQCKEVTNQKIWSVNNQSNSQIANQVQTLDVATFGYAENLQAKQWPAFLSRFFFATSITIKQLRNRSNNENTVKSTAFWLRVWKKQCLEKEIAKEIENYEPTQLIILLERFYVWINYFCTWCARFASA